MSVYKLTVDRERLVNEVRYNKHPRRKNNDVVAAMYAMYQTPKSLEEVGRAYHKTRQSIYELFRTRGYELRGKQLKGLQVLDGINFTEMKGGYLRGTTLRGRTTMHRYVWQKHRGKIPVGYVVYHKNGNRADNKISNLRLVALSDMPRTFNPEGRNQFSSVKL